MTDTNCGRLVLRQTGIDVSRKGKLQITGWDETNNREDCCGHEFTIRCPSDAIDTTTYGSWTDIPQSQVQSLLQRNGRKIGVICAGLYDIWYIRGETRHGCGGIVCQHYANYFVTPLGPLPGMVGATSGTSNNEPARKMLELLKKSPVRYRSSKKQDFIIGYWPWWGNAYTTGSMTWKIEPITGMILEWYI